LEYIGVDDPGIVIKMVSADKGGKQKESGGVSL
jgi:hypothetical protein